MKAIIKNDGVLCGILSLALLTIQAAFGQTNLQFTGINTTPENAIQLYWTSTNGELYQVQYANALATNADGSTAWQVLYDDYPSQGTNTFIGDFGDYNVAPQIPHPKYSPMRFYQILDEGADTLPDAPSVAITSPASGEGSLGELSITVVASTDQPVLSWTKLYVDGQEMQSPDATTNYTDDTGVTNYEVDTYSINTCEWENGTHTLFATAECDSGYGDAMNAPPVYNAHAVSPFVSVSFTNLITGISFSQPSFDPSQGETQQVSAVFTANCNWTLNIVDVNSNVVQTASGSGISMLYNWDGTDNGTNLPIGIYYYYISATTNGESSDVEIGGSGGSSGSPPSPDFASSASFRPDASELWAISADSGDAVPLALYPPGFDTNGLTLVSASPSQIRAARTPVARTSFGAISREDSPGASGSGAGSGPAAQSSPASPQRPPNNPVRGSAGTFAVAYQTFTGNGPSGYHLNAPADRMYFPAIKVQNGTGGTFEPLNSQAAAAKNFISEMLHWGWTTNFVKADNQLQLSDMQGSGTPFNQATLGLFMTHGTYGTTGDYYANGCEQMYFPITSGTSAQWLRMSDMNLGGTGTGGLKWMAIDGCFSLYHTDWQSMQYNGIYPYNNNLHLLLGADTITYGSVHTMQRWARFLNFGTSTNYSPLTIRNAWYQAGQVDYQNAHFPQTIIYAVAGDNNCYGDTLQSSNSPGGSWFYDSQTVFTPH